MSISFQFCNYELQWRLKDFAVHWNEQEHQEKNAVTPYKDKSALPPGVARPGDEPASLIIPSIICEENISIVQYLISSEIYTLLPGGQSETPAKDQLQRARANIK